MPGDCIWWKHVPEFVYNIARLQRIGLSSGRCGLNPNLIPTKIIVPTRRADILRRTRLLDFLHEAIARKLILVSATAGFGKSSLLIDFAHDTELALCWYALDENDRDLRTFSEYLVASVQRRFPEFGARMTALLQQRTDQDALNAFAGAFVSDVLHDIDEFFIIVLEDFHLVENNTPITQFLDRLLSYLPENAHLILSSRTVPDTLTLTRLTAQRQVVALGTDDLRFTADEIHALVSQNFEMDITPTTAAELVQQSDGWITGLVLTMPTLWRGLRQDGAQGYAPGSRLFEYLAVEVFDHQSPALQQFLLESSMVAEMDAAMCNELFGRDDSLTQFQLAEKRKLFVTRVGVRSYRYHHLFREFLQARFRDAQPARYAELQRRIAAWFEANGKIDQAIERWLAANEASHAARLIEAVLPEYYEAGRWTTLAQWLDALPQAILHATPNFLFRRALIHGELGALDQAERYFSQAVEGFRARRDSHNVARALIESARYQADLQVVNELVERALALVPATAYDIQALGYRTLGSRKALAGDHASALPLMERAAGLYEIANERYEQFNVEMNLGSLYHILGDRARALGHLEKVRAYWQRVGNSAKLANTLNSIAVVRYEQSELEEAIALAQEALEHAKRAGHLRTESYSLASLGDIYRDQGKLQPALQAYTQVAANTEKIREDNLATYALASIVEVWRMAGDLDAAEQALARTLKAGSTRRAEFNMALGQLAACGLRLAQKQPDAALRHLDYAMPQLEHAEAKRELGRAYFYYAHAAFLRRRETEALRHLRALAKLGKQLGEDQFLVHLASPTRNLIEFALKRHVGVSYFRPLVKKLDRLPRTSVTASELEVGLPELEAYTFGEARVFMDGKAIAHHAWKTNKTKELFFFFATQPQAWRKEQVADALWQDFQRNPASDVFHQTLHRLRHALFHDCILHRDGWYQMHPEVVRWLDVQEFEQEFDALPGITAPEEKIQQLVRIVALYHGDFLEEIYSDWCRTRREYLRERHLDALAQLGDAWREFGSSRSAEETYHKILRLEPAREETYRALMKLYAARGDHGAVAQTYQQCERALREHLDVPPMTETLELYRRLRQI